MLKYCKAAGVGVIPYSPLNRGALARPLGAEGTVRSESNMQLFGTKALEAEEEITRRVEKVAKDKGWLMSEVALAWVMERVTSPIVGFSSVSATLHVHQPLILITIATIRRRGCSKRLSPATS